MQQNIFQIQSAGSNDELIRVCNDHIDEILEAGYNKPVSSMTLTSKNEVCKSLKMHHCLLKAMGELDQLKSGLATLGVSNAMATYPKLMIPLFVAGEAEPLTAGIKTRPIM